jgi:hypothetical protein
VLQGQPGRELLLNSVPLKKTRLMMAPAFQVASTTPSTLMLELAGIQEVKSKVNPDMQLVH